jgi:hypothetical protein
MSAYSYPAFGVSGPTSHKSQAIAVLSFLPTAEGSSWKAGVGSEGCFNYALWACNQQTGKVVRYNAPHSLMVLR